MNVIKSSVSLVIEEKLKSKALSYVTRILLNKEIYVLANTVFDEYMIHFHYI